MNDRRFVVTDDLWTRLEEYLADILDRIHDHKINRLDELLPWNWTPAISAMDSQAA